MEFIKPFNLQASSSRVVSHNSIGNVLLKKRGSEEKETAMERNWLERSAAHHQSPVRRLQPDPPSEGGSCGGADRCFQHTGSFLVLPPQSVMSLATQPVFTTGVRCLLTLTGVSGYSVKTTVRGSTRSESLVVILSEHILGI